MVINHHRIESCGPSNGRHKIAYDRPDFFAMLRSSPSDIDDALDTLHEPNAVFRQFPGSASMTFFVYSLFFGSLFFLSFISLLFLSCLFLLFLYFLVFSFLFVCFSFFSFISYLIFFSLFIFPN